MPRLCEANSLNQYTSVGGTSYTYDDNGNLAYDGVLRYYYDSENRLTDVNDANDNPVASYAYDYQGRRISRTIHGAPDATIKYVYDGAQIIAEYDANDTLLRKFVYGPGIDEPICLIDVADASARYFYHCDGLGSVVALCDVNNVPVERYAYDVFGWPTIRDANGTEIAASAFANPYLFTGRAYDPETALYYYRARYYDYYTGRFLEPDPIAYADGLNLYRYCNNNPANLLDPLGNAGIGPLPADAGVSLSPDHAAMDASNEILSMPPNAQNVEWFYYVYAVVKDMGLAGDPSYYYAYTEPQAGSEASCANAVELARSLVPLYAYVVGAGHSHPANSSSENFSQNPVFLPDGSVSYSGDFPFMRQEAARFGLGEFPFYLLTPSGMLKRAVAQFISWLGRYAIPAPEPVNGWPKNCPKPEP